MRLRGGMPPKKMRGADKRDLERKQRKKAAAE
jgi:hypothetical protein